MFGCVEFCFVMSVRVGSVRFGSVTFSYVMSVSLISVPFCLVRLRRLWYVTLSKVVLG